MLLEGSWRGDAAVRTLWNVHLWNLDGYNLWLSLVSLTTDVSSSANVWDDSNLQGLLSLPRRRSAEFQYQFDTPAGSARPRGPDASRKQKPSTSQKRYETSLCISSGPLGAKPLPSLCSVCRWPHQQQEGNNSDIAHSLSSLPLHYSNEKSRRRSLFTVSFIYCAKVHGNKSVSFWYCLEWINVDRKRRQEHSRDDSVTPFSQFSLISYECIH